MKKNYPYRGGELRRIKRELEEVENKKRQAAHDRFIIKTGIILTLAFSTPPLLNQVVQYLTNDKLVETHNAPSLRESEKCTPANDLNP